MNQNRVNNTQVVTKSNKSIIYLVLVLFLFLFGILGFGVYKLNSLDSSSNKKNDVKEEVSENDKSKDKEDTKDDEKEDKLDEDTVLQIQEPVKNASYTFFKDKNVTLELSDTESIDVTAYYYLDNKDGLFYLRREVFIKGVMIEEIAMIDSFTSRDAAVAAYKDDNLGIVHTFKDTINENNYAIYYLTRSDNTLQENLSTAYILGNDGTLYKKIPLVYDDMSFIGIFVDHNNLGDKNYITKNDLTTYSVENLTDYPLYVLYANNQLVDEHDTYVYFVTGDCSKFEEYKLSFEDGLYKEELINTYTEEQFIAAGGC